MPWLTLPHYSLNAFHGDNEQQKYSQKNSRHMPNDIWAKRMATLYGLSLRRTPSCILLTADNFLPKLPPCDLFDNHDLRLTRGEDMAPELVLEQAIEWGFERVPMVSRPGEVAMRGDIVDIFLAGYERPVRIEFFGDTIEDIRLFDGGNQRSLGKLEECVLIPVSPIVTTEALKIALERWNRLQSEYAYQRAADGA